MPRPATALLVIDVQPDFLPGGALAVEGGDEILPAVSRLLASDRFAVRVATQDWHPPGHVSFASSHPGRRPFEEIELHGGPQTLWPDHCVRGRQGATLHAGLPLDRLDLILRKGTDPSVDSYSGFRGNRDEAGERPATGLTGYLRERGISRVVPCGLARDVCVRFSAEDAAAAGFETVLMWDACRSVDPSRDAELRRSLEGSGIRVIDGPEIPA